MVQHPQLAQAKYISPSLGFPGHSGSHHLRVLPRLLDCGPFLPGVRPYSLCIPEERRHSAKAGLSLKEKVESLLK